MTLKRIIILLSFVGLLVYISSLFVPYYSLYNLVTTSYYTGLDFFVPVMSLILIFPIVYFLIQLKTKSTVILAIIFSFLLTFPVNFLFYLLIDLEKYTADYSVAIITPQIGYYMHIIASFILLIASFLKLGIVKKNKIDGTLLDEL